MQCFWNCWKRLGKPVKTRSSVCSLNRALGASVSSVETTAIDGLVLSWSENISVSFCLRTPWYGLTLWCALGLLVGGAIQVPQLQLQLQLPYDVRQNNDTSLRFFFSPIHFIILVIFSFSHCFSATMHVFYIPAWAKICSPCTMFCPPPGRFLIPMRTLFVIGYACIWTPMHTVTRWSTVETRIGASIKHLWVFAKRRAVRCDGHDPTPWRFASSHLRLRANNVAKKAQRWAELQWKRHLSLTSW